MAITTMEREYLMEGMTWLLEEYDYKYTEDALNKIIDEWDRQKAGLVDAFKKHPNYVEGKFMIAFDADYERGIDRMASKNFSSWLRNYAYPAREGKLPKEMQDRTFDWEYLPYELSEFFRYLDNYAERCISESTATYLNEHCPAIHAHAGQKTSRVVNKLCCYLGYDKVDGYNREFAKYADSLSPLTIKRHTILSINPLDYLTMSFGNSWASCHTIDKKNRRGMPNSYSGMHCGGTMSYMLDGTSIITYVHTHETEDHEEGKLYRNMFHFNEGTLVQGRIYPQGNDGVTDLYTIFRRYMQIELTKLLGLDADNWVKRTSSCGHNVASYGVHYRDYDHFSGCNVSYPREMPNAANHVITVGHARICPKCGYEVSDNYDSGYLNHESCNDVNTEDLEW